MIIQDRTFDKKTPSYILEKWLGMAPHVSIKANEIATKLLPFVINHLPPLPEFPFEIENHTWSYKSDLSPIGMSPNYHVLALQEQTEKQHLWFINRKNEFLLNLPVRLNELPRAFAFSPTGDKFAVGFASGEIQIFSLNQERVQLLSRVLPAKNGTSIAKLQWDNESHLISTSSNKVIERVDLSSSSASRAEIASSGKPSNFQVAWHPYQPRFLVATFDPIHKQLRFEQRDINPMSANGDHSLPKGQIHADEAPQAIRWLDSDRLVVCFSKQTFLYFLTISGIEISIQDECEILLNQETPSTLVAQVKKTKQIALTNLDLEQRFYAFPRAASAWFKNMRSKQGAARLVRDDRMPRWDDRFSIASALLTIPQSYSVLTLETNEKPLCFCPEKKLAGIFSEHYPGEREEGPRARMFDIRTLSGKRLKSVILSHTQSIEFACIDPSANSKKFAMIQDRSLICDTYGSDQSPNSSFTSDLDNMTEDRVASMYWRNEFLYLKLSEEGFIVNLQSDHIYKPTYIRFGQGASFQLTGLSLHPKSRQATISWFDPIKQIAQLVIIIGDNKPLFYIHFKSEKPITIIHRDDEKEVVLQSSSELFVLKLTPNHNTDRYELQHFFKLVPVEDSSDIFYTTYRPKTLVNESDYNLVAY